MAFRFLHWSFPCKEKKWEWYADTQHWIAWLTLASFSMPAFSWGKLSGSCRDSPCVSLVELCCVWHSKALLWMCAKPALIPDRNPGLDTASCPTAARALFVCWLLWHYSRVSDRHWWQTECLQEQIGICTDCITAVNMAETVQSAQMHEMCVVLSISRLCSCYYPDRSRLLKWQWLWKGGGVFC